ncbi:MAG: tungstate ABC transporter substrate-binding protein WtpA [Methanobrevibacter sp. CfCl-M3]
MIRKISGFFLIFMLILSFAVSSASAADGDHLVIYAADSLKGAMETYIPLYNRLTDHKDDFVILCCTGSNSLVNDITNNNATPDVLFSADYKLIDDRLMPKYTLWNAEFARNSIVIAYRKNSANASNINGDNWYKVFNDSNVMFGFGDPNKDPCGYRSVMAIALANNYAGYSNPNIFNDLIAANSDIYATKNGTGYDIYSPTNITANIKKIIVDPHAAESLDSLKKGKIDYAFVYKNQAEEAKYNDSSIDYVTLPNELSLNDTKYEEEYSHIRLFENYDDSSAMKIITLTPIVYGLTQLSVGKSPDAAQSFLEMFCALTAYENPEDPSAILRYMDHIFPLLPSAMTKWDDIPIWMQRFMDSGSNIDSITINPNNGTIQESVDKLPSGGTLYLDPGTYSQPGDYNIEISKNINIKAVNKQVTIDGNKTNQIFNVNKGSTLNIERLNLVNGYSNTNGFGGAIFNRGECGIIECNLVNNTASNCGGAITNTGICNIVGSNLTNNTAHNMGGAIHDYGINSKLTVNNSIFIENICYDTDYGGRGSGGAISSTLDGILKLNNNDFTKGNNATLGPSLSIWGGSTCTVDSCKFNKRSDLQSADATINTANCTFLEDNSDNLCFTTNVKYSRGSNLFSESFR